MINALRAEWVRVGRVRPLVAYGVPLAFFPALLTVLAFATGTGAPGPGPASHLSTTRSDLTAPDGYLVGLDPAATVIGVIILVFAAVSFGADYTHGTLRNLLVREPRRSQLLAGRLLALLSFVAIGVALAVGAAAAAGWIAAASYDVSTGAWTAVVPEGAAAWSALLVAATGWATVGAALGILFRSVPASVAVGVVWALPVESALSAVWDSADRTLPGAVFSAVAARGTDALTLATALVLTGTYTAVAFVAAARTFKARDVLA